MRIYFYIRYILFLLPPEVAHFLTLKLLWLFDRLCLRRRMDDYSLNIEVAGMKFSNPFGVAAGFDKNGEVPNAVCKLGFGFAEIGTVTPLPQIGNSLPRLFRLPEDEAIINRMGFNNHGAEKVYMNLSRQHLPYIVGVNIGANKETDNRIIDYQIGAKKFSGIANYLVMNVSSPNTPALRELQHPDALESIFKSVEEVAKTTPVFFKIDPDLDQDALQKIAKFSLKVKLKGLIISNTTVKRNGLKSSQQAETGGLSGRPLMDQSTKALSEMYSLTQGKIMLISVGGIANAEDAYRKIRSGASLVQLYSGLVYRGPQLIRELKAGLVECLRRDGILHVKDAIGIDVNIQKEEKIISDQKPTKSVINVQ